MDKLTTQTIFQEVEELIKDGKNNTAIAKILNKEHPEAHYTPSCDIIKATRQKFLAEYVIPEKEIFFKDSLIEYDKIKDETDDLPERKEALKIKLTALRDRNDLLGLSKSAVNVQINFEGKNYTDDDFITDHNVVDVEVAE